MNGEDERADGPGRIRLYVEWSSGYDPDRAGGPGFSWYGSDEVGESFPLSVPGTGQLGGEFVNDIIRKHLRAAAAEIDSACRRDAQKVFEETSDELVQALLPDVAFANSHTSPAAKEHAQRVLRNSLRGLHGEKHRATGKALVQFIQRAAQVADITAPAAKEAK